MTGTLFLLGPQGFGPAAAPVLGGPAGALLGAVVGALAGLAGGVLAVLLSGRGERAARTGLSAAAGVLTAAAATVLLTVDGPALGPGLLAGAVAAAVARVCAPWCLRPLRHP